jgi:hypothetical protein
LSDPEPDAVIPVPIIDQATSNFYHPMLAKYVKMCRMGVPKDMISYKMQTDGFSDYSSLLDKVTTTSSTNDDVELSKFITQLLKSHPINEVTSDSKKSDAERTVQSQAPVTVATSATIVKNTTATHNKPKPPPPPPPPPPLSRPQSVATSSNNENKEKPAPPPPFPSIDNSVPKVPICEHPRYQKYFKMLKIGLTKEMIQQKLLLDSVDKRIILLDSQTLVPLNVTDDKDLPLPPISESKFISKESSALKDLLQSRAMSKSQAITGNDSVVRKKKVFLTGVGDDVISQHETIWSHDGDDDAFLVDSLLQANQEEFQRLFVEQVSPKSVRSSNRQESSPNKTTVGTKEKMSEGSGHFTTTKFKKESVILLSAKRAQNISIFLSSLNFTTFQSPTSVLRRTSVTAIQQLNQPAQHVAITHNYAKLAEAIYEMNFRSLTSIFTLEQLILLIEMLPNDEEIELVKNYLQVNGIDNKYSWHENDENQILYQQERIDALGKAEQFIYYMFFVPFVTLSNDISKQRCIFMTKTDIISRIECIIYKQQYLTIYQECKHKCTLLEVSLDQIKSNQKFKKFCKMVLKFVNQLNAGQSEESENCSTLVYKGITLDSLSQLAVIKTFDKKTTILQYIITLLARQKQHPIKPAPYPPKMPLPGHDDATDLLIFPEELKQLSEAAKIAPLQSLQKEMFHLNEQLANHVETLTQCLLRIPMTSFSGGKSSSGMGMFAGDLFERASQNIQDTIQQFSGQLQPLLQELLNNIEHVQHKYYHVLLYFGEISEIPQGEKVGDYPSVLASSEFFSKFNHFVKQFTLIREQVTRSLQQEKKKSQPQSKGPSADQQNTTKSVLANLRHINRASVLKTSHAT